MKKCKVCGKKLTLCSDLRYEVTRFSYLSEEPTIYEAFDCPKCGCQNIVGIRETKNELISASD